MRGLVFLLAAAALVTLVSSPEAARIKLVVNVGPAPLNVGNPVPIVVRGPVRSVDVDAVSPAGRTTRIHVLKSGRDVWRGVFRFDRPGRWRVRARGGDIRVSVPVVIRPPVATAPPANFGALGTPGCSPPSPRNQGDEPLGRLEVFGTATGGARFWGLLFIPVGTTWGSDDTAVLDDLVGKEIKIVFKLTTGLPSRFYAVAPDGSRTKPVSGPTPHLSSNWNRAGREWGTTFVFDEPGCWAIHAAAGPTVGDIWLDVRS